MKIQPITKEDLEFIRNTNKIPKGLILFCFAIVTVGIVVYMISNIIIFIVFPIILVTMFSVFILLGKLFLRKEIVAGMKVVREGKVEAKEKVINENTDYYLIIDGVKYNVIEKLWNLVKEGDYVEFSLFYDSKIMFKILSKQV
ncbi:MAG: hypothetical protein K2X86_06450 [Cytophagaceae bacterium]|nr:hypothetical protein [Cytophagaceae bacterium]